jgi:hypothetical protein
VGGKAMMKLYVTAAAFSLIFRLLISLIKNRLTAYKETFPSPGSMISLDLSLI